MNTEKNFDWDSYEAPSYKAPTRFGGLFVVTEAITKRLPYPTRILAWRGETKDPKFYYMNMYIGLLEILS